MSHVERCCENEEQQQRRRRNLTSSSSSSNSETERREKGEEEKKKKNNLQLTRTLFTCRVSHRQEKKSKTSNPFYLLTRDFSSFLLVRIF